MFKIGNTIVSVGRVGLDGWAIGISDNGDTVSFIDIDSDNAKLRSDKDERLINKLIPPEPTP